MAGKANAASLVADQLSDEWVSRRRELEQARARWFAHVQQRRHGLLAQAA